MSSIAAVEVAKEVISEVVNGRIPKKTKIAIKHGYSLESARVGKPAMTKAYKDTMKPIVEQMEIERQRAIKAMKTKISTAKYRDLTDAADKLTKNIQLLSGGATDNVGLRIELSEAVMKKNGLNAHTDSSSQ